MAENVHKSLVPESWVGRQVHIRYSDADVPRWIDCTLEEAGEYGVVAVSDEKTTFFPWSSVIKMDLGAATTAGTPES